MNKQRLKWNNWNGYISATKCYRFQGGSISFTLCCKALPALRLQHCYRIGIIINIRKSHTSMNPVPVEIPPSTAPAFCRHRCCHRHCGSCCEQPRRSMLHPSGCFTQQHGNALSLNHLIVEIITPVTEKLRQVLTNIIKRTFAPSGAFRFF